MLALLIIIYISFISLGLPDSLLGSAWPVMYEELSVPVSHAGILSMIVSLGTVVSSFLSAKLIERLDRKSTRLNSSHDQISYAVFCLKKKNIPLLFFAIPLGLGAGSVDAALNNFVALHYKAKHMNWLHSFWGVGATTGPVIMSFWLAKKNNWNMGYITIGIIQSFLVIALMFSLPLWNNSQIEKKGTQNKDNKKDDIKVLSLPKIFQIPKAKMALLAFFSYCSLELTTGLWAGSYAVNNYGVSSEVAAFWTSIYYLGITIGRFLSGFMSVRFSNTKLIKIGLSGIFIGITLIVLPLPVWKIPIGLSLIGLGCAPIYPSMLHQTPRIFGKELSQSMMGIQMAFAYIGSTFTPPLFGFVAEHIGISLFPFFLLMLAFVLFFATETVSSKVFVHE